MMGNLAKRLLQPINTSVVSIMGFYNFLTGFWLLLPINSFRAGTGNLFTELSLGLIMLIIGSLILWGSLKVNDKILKIGAASGFFFWLVWTLILIYVNFTGVGWINALMITMYCGFVFLNLRIKDRDLHDKNK
jgi:hypothetical protein